MSAALSISRALVAFVAASGFLFGQLFFGTFELHATIAGVAGLLAVLLGLVPARAGKGPAALAALCCLAALAAAGVDVADYYRDYNPNSGSYYPWILVAPFCIGLLVLLFHAIGRVRE